MCKTERFLANESPERTCFSNDPDKLLTMKDTDEVKI